MRKLLFTLLYFPIIVFGQNSTIRFFPLYPMPVAIFAEDKGIAFGTTLGYDFGISDNEAIEINFKPRIFILDGDEDAYELRFNINYKRFIRYNFYTSTGIGFNLYNYNSYGPDEYTDGNPDHTILFATGPNLAIGRRMMFNKRIFIDVGFGISVNFTSYSKTSKTRPLDDSISEPWEYITILTHNEKYISYLSHIVVFQFGYIL